MKWENAGDAASRRAIFESCQFFTQLGTLRDDPANTEHEPPAPTREDVQVVAASVARVEASVAKLIRTVTIMLWVIVAVVILLRVFR